MLVRCKEISRRETDLQRNWHGDEEPTTIVILYRIEEIFVGVNNLLGSKVGSMIKKDGDLYLLDITTSTVLPKQPAEFIGVIRNWTSGIETLDLHLAGINFPVYAPHCNPKNHNPTLSESDYQKVGQFAKTLKEWVQVGLNQGYKSQAGLDWLEKQTTSSNEFVAKWADWQSKHIDQKASDSKEITCSDDEN